MNHPVVYQFLVSFMVSFFFVFGIIGLAVGVGLIFNHAGMHRLFGVMNQWVSMRRSTRWLAIPRDTGPALHHFRRLLGTAFILVAASSTFVLVTQVDVSRVVSVFGLEIPHAFVTWVMECMRLCLIVGSVLAIAIGFMLIFSPKTLYAIEARANHWYSLRNHSQRSDVMHLGLDRWVEHYPRAIGGTVALAALIVVVDFGILLFAHS